MPDIRNFRDIFAAPEVFLDQVLERSQLGLVADLDLFPYPKSADKVRWMSVLHPTDLVIARVWAGRIVARTEQITPSAVYSNRLATNPPAWMFRNFRGAWLAMRDRAVELVRQGYVMAQLDVSSYYANVELDDLAKMLVTCRCEPEATVALVGNYERWNSQGLSGLPIGTEDAAVMGNAYLLPLDWRLLSIPSIKHLRWVDDVFVFARDLATLEDAVAHTDSELRLLSLERSEEKTTYYESEESALEALEDTMLTSLYEAGPRRRLTGHLLHRRFIEYIAEAEVVSARHYRFIVKGLLYRRDPFGSDEIAQRPDLFNIDPALSGEYLRAVALSHRSSTNALFRMLEDGLRNPQDLTDARDLHILRALEGRIWGQDEGELFHAIALDEDRRGPIRAWAIACLARTPRWDSEEIVERVLEETHIYVQRSMVLCLRRSITERRVQLLIRHLRSRPTALFSCAVWVD